MADMSFDTRQLAELAEIFSGFAFKSKDLGKSGIPVIKIANIQNKRVLRDCRDHLPEELFTQKLERYLLKKRDCLVAMTGAGSVGKVGKMWGGNRSYLVNQRVGIIRPYKNKCNPDYLYFVLSIDHYEKTLYSLGLGAGQPNVSAKEIGSLRIPCPNQDVQRKIASILSAYDDLIENNLQRIKILEEMAQALYREWFVKFRFPGHEKVRIVDSPLGKILEGWEWRPVGDFLEKSIGGGWGKDEQSEIHTNSVRVIRGTDFRRITSGSFGDVPSRFVKDSALRSRELRYGDLIVENSVNASSRCVGTPFVVSEGILRQLGGDSICASFCKMYRPKRTEFATLLYLHMKHLLDERKMNFYQNVAANGIGNFQSKRFLSDECVPVPRDDDRLSAMLELLGDLTASTYCERIATLRQTRDLLLPKLISGKLDVSDLDIDIPEEIA